MEITGGSKVLEIPVDSTNKLELENIRNWRVFAGDIKSLVIAPLFSKLPP
jgi:hypothetical protein